MNPGTVALTVTVTIVAAGAALGFLAGVRRKMDLEQWTTGGRGFGTLLMYLLLAGEYYTTFSFLGASGWAYSRGGPALYILAYITLGQVFAFYIVPAIWEAGKKHGLQTQSDFFLLRYGNKYLAALVGVVGIAAIIPYLQLQIVGLGIIVSATSFDAISRTAAMIISVTLLAAFVVTSGVRAVAWVSVLKDALMVAAMLTVGIGIPYLHFGGIGKMFAALREAHPSHLTMPGATANLGHTWFITTVLLSTLGGFMWPHSFGAIFTARSSDTLRRNTVTMPLYGSSLVFVFFVGFTAVLVTPGLRDGDLAFLTLVRQSFPPWLLGAIGGAGALTAMVPASILILTAATLFAKNFYRPLFAPAMTDDQVGKLARAMVVVIGLASLYLAISGSTTLVSLLLLGYAMVDQFLPGVVLGLFWSRTNAQGVLTGILAGCATVAALFLGHHDPLFGWNAGFVALCVNLGATVLVSLLGRSTRRV
ncbi:MAG: sodium:solute symporter family protein [Bryobacterales bacterium]|nr:sodium:solute symporter family protein [Bryobacterales bacterium]